ncbi:diacylglycerol kinase [Phyllobacterium sp. LjRoot231]|uniref:diacylglycerol kinase n=1 Tax=Phyllobacterium sp. LjRoot231 TaxID=3342289 RepID=UPI003ECE9292
MRGAKSHAYKRHEISYKVANAPKAKYIRLSLRCRRERSFRTQILMAVLVVIGVLFLGASLAWMAIITLAIALVLAAELFNSALETLVDHLHPEFHAEIRVVKDMAAGGVLLVSLGAAVVGVLFFLAQR